MRHSLAITDTISTINTLLWQDYDINKQKEVLIVI